MKAANKGLYCAPLRMMAWEVREKLLKAGIPCNLITGQAKLRDPKACHTSITIEGVTEQMDSGYQVAVIVGFSFFNAALEKAIHNDRMRYKCLRIRREAQRGLMRC
jgi:hypothetical protein